VKKEILKNKNFNLRGQQKLSERKGGVLKNFACFARMAEGDIDWVRRRWWVGVGLGFGGGWVFVVGWVGGVGCYGVGGVGGVDAYRQTFRLQAFLLPSPHTKELEFSYLHRDFSNCRSDIEKPQEGLRSYEDRSREQ